MTEANLLKPDEELLVNKEFQALLDDYIASPHRQRVEIVTRAFNLAKDAHSGARRRSGEPYIIHPIAVARIVAKDLGLGSTSICAALLHDVVEDTDYTVDDIKNLFNEKIANIVDGLTKIAGGKFGEQASSQAENFRKLLLTMSSDIRVILIKIADRLHNMRTLDSMLPSKQYKIAGETQYIYAPLAHRLGLYTIKSELEDLSFKYENPQIYAEINRKLIETETQRQALFAKFSSPIISELNRLGIHYELKARIKSVYSIWNKMKSKKVPFEEVFDIFAGRIIFTPREGMDEANECWNIYNAITDVYSLHPDRTRDWVKQPKANGYQALHVTAMGPEGRWIEVQIRSVRMNEIAEKGFAAHFNYKHSKESPDQLETFLAQIREILEHPEPNSVDLLDTIKLNLFAAEIIVFTPKGDIKMLPLGATALDFAFTLHTNLGYNCIGAKVNHKLVPISYVLQSGDQVEILTSQSQKPKEEWLKFVHSASARSKIQNYLRKQQKQFYQEGEEIYTKFISDHFSENKPEQWTIVRYYKLGNKEELFQELGAKHITLDQNLIQHISTSNNKSVGFNSILKAFIPSKKGNNKNISTSRHEAIDKKKTFLLQEKDFPLKYSLQPCCNAIPGDPSMGYLTEDDHLEVHSLSCSRALRLKSNFGNRVISTQWELFDHHTFPVRIDISGIDGKGVLNDISRALSNDITADIRKISIEANGGIFNGTLILQIHNSVEANQICAKLAKIKSINRAVRIFDINK